MIVAALCLSLCLIMPFLTGQIPEIGSMLLPMHYGVFLCAYVADKKWATVVGFIAPLMRSLLFGMPVFFPMAVAMSIELATYGFVAGYLNEKLPKKLIYTYVSLLVSMIAGRIVWGLVSVLLYGLKGEAFTWSMFIGGSLLKAVPGIIFQLVLIPLIIEALRKSNIIDKKATNE